MKKYIIILFAFIGSFANAQGYDFQQLCLDCASANGFTVEMIQQIGLNILQWDVFKHLG